MTHENVLIQICLNGEMRDISSGLHLQDLLSELGFKPGTVVVEHNEKVILKSELTSVFVRENDKIEIVRFVGGG